MIRTVSLLALGWLLLLPVWGAVEEMPENPPTSIAADQISSDKERVVAQGHVVLTHGVTQIETDTLTYDSKTGVIESPGDVVLREEGEKIIGKHLVYNVITKHGTLSTISGSTKNLYAQGEPIRGALFFEGKDIEINRNVIVFKAVDASTCDYPWGQKHYHISAEEIKIIPGDKMIISHGRIWIGKTPLWHEAKLVIDLHPRLTHRQSYAPHFGYNKVDGFFIKTVTNYLAYKDNYGNILADYYQKTGLASGIEHQYPLGSKGSGHVSFYHQNGGGFQKFTREQIAVGDQYDFGKGLALNGSFNLFRYRVPPIISPDTYSSQAALTKRGERYNWSLTESNNVTNGFNNSQTVQYHQLQDFGNNFRMDLSESFYKSAQGGGTTNMTFHNLTSFSKEFSGWGGNLLFEKTDSSLFGGGFINRTPELSLHTDDLSLKSLKIPYQLSTSFGNYFESFRNLQASRVDFQVNVPQRRFDLSKNLHFITSELYRQDFYNTGTFYPTQSMSARYILGSVNQLSTSLGNHFDALVDYRSQSNIGFDPLVYDIVNPYKTLTGELSFYNRDDWRINVGTGYDYKNRFYQQLVTRVDFRPLKDWAFHFDGNYDPNFHQWQNLIAQADVWALKDVRVQYWSSFSLLNGQVGYQDLALTKDWHDWEGRLIYRWRSQEVFLFFNLKAFPEQQVQLGINPLMNTDPTAAEFEVH